MVQLLLFISHYQLIRYESSRGHKIARAKPNQTGNRFGEKKKANKSEENGQESTIFEFISPGDRLKLKNGGDICSGDLKHLSYIYFVYLKLVRIT